MSDKSQAIINRLNEVTNINNINNSITLNTTSNVSNESISEANTTPCSLDLLAEKVVLLEENKLPPAWNAVKIDLFDNGKTKTRKTIKFTIIRNDETRFTCSAALNSPYHHVYRGKDEGLGTRSFWRAIDERIAYFKEQKQEFSISKVGLPKKGGSIQNLATAIYCVNDVWHCDIIKNNEIYTYTLTGIVQEGFRNKNGIATGFWGMIKRNWATQEELGI